MTKKKSISVEVVNPSTDSKCSAQLDSPLRRLAEKKAKENETNIQEMLSPEDVSQLLHELRVHQIELEMQNDELRRVQEVNEALRVRYFDLYNLAPVGYFILSEQGMILEANLTAAILFDIDRVALVKKQITNFICPEDQNIYYLHCKSLCEFGETKACELHMMKKDGTKFWVHLDTTIVQDVDNRPVYHVTVSDINDRKLRDEEIKKEKETAQLYLDIAGSMLLVLDSAGNISLVNKKGCEILEGTCDELIGMNWFDHFPPIAEKEKLQDVFVTLMHDEIKPSVEYVENLVISKKGTQKWIRWHNTIIKNTEGTIIGTLSSGEDITEHKKLEEELEKSKIRLDLAAEGSKIGVWEHDLVNNTSIRNLIHDQIFGYNNMISEWEIKILFEHIILEDRSLVQAAFDRAMKTNKLDFECRIIWPDKTIHWITETGKVIQDDTGKPQKILGTVMDITERKRTERRLEESELRYRRLFESAKDGILLLDFGTGKIMDVNPFLIDLLGYSKVDFLDKFLWEIGSFKDLIQSKENFLILQTKDYIRYENLPLEAKGGKKVDVEFISNVYDVDSRKTIQCNIRDITGQNRLEKKLDEAHYGIKKRTKDLEMINENLDSFAYSVSHDLRSPLRAISGFSQVLIDTQGDNVNDEMRHYLNRINEGAQKMGQLIDDLLGFSRATRSEIKYEKINVENIINDLIKAYRDVEQDRDIEFIVNPLGEVEADREMLKVVFSNLIQNAIKFTIDRKKACIEIGRELKEDDIQFYVKDNGIGFDMRYKDKLFTAFQRLHTDARFPGTGIGLSTVKRIVLKHGGNIWAEGEVDKGAEFYFTLPSKKDLEE